MVYVYLNGLPNVLTFSDAIKKLILSTLPQAIAGIEELKIGIHEVTVFASADLVQWGRGTVVRCIIESDLFEGEAVLKQKVVDTVYVQLSSFCENRIVNNSATEITTCRLVVETRTLARSTESFRTEIITGAELF